MSNGAPGGLVGRTLGGYRLTALIGSGGMAEVYRGEDMRLGRAVAVKVLSKKLAVDEEYIQRFRDEARRVAALNHPNVVQVYHYDEQKGLLFIVLPLLAESLRQRLERVGKLPIDQFVQIVSEVAAGLDAAHAQGIIHRDVKPENIMLNAEGHALLADFGIARDDVAMSGLRTPQTLASGGIPIGTIAYMAPEQLRHANIDTRVDIYALGAVLYELLTGRVPHDAATIYEIAALTLSAPVIPPSTYNAEVWPELESAVLTALAYEPADRFATAGAFAQALRAAMAQSPRDSGAFIGSTIPLNEDAPYSSVNALSGVTIPIFPTESDLALPRRASAPLRSYPPASRTTPAATSTIWPQFNREHAPTRRRVPLALVGLIVVAVCALSALLVTGTLPIGHAVAENSVSSPSAHATQSATGLPGGTTLAGSPGVTTLPGSPGAGGTATPTGALMPTATVTITASPTDSPTTGPTATPGAPNVSAPNFSVGGKHRCAGTQTIVNQGATDISWVWTVPVTPPLPGDFKWQLNGGAMRSGLPSSGDLAPGGSDTVTVGINCDKNDHPFNVTFSASDVGFPVQTTRSTFTMDVHGS